MAGDWLKIEKDTIDKPEVLAIAVILGITPDEAFGRCFRVWRWADSQTVDGYVRRVTTEVLDGIAGKPGFSHALLEVGWLNVRTGALELPHFNRHMGEGAKKRALTANRMARSRGEKRDAVVTLGASPEKRREEKSLEEPPQPPLRGGGGGPSNPSQNPQMLPIPPPFDLTAEGLAQTWCFHSTRRRLGTPRDSPLDMTSEFAELLRLGHDPGKLRAALVDERRDRGEHFWQFKRRVMGDGARRPAALDKTTEDIAREQLARRERSRREASEAVPLGEVIKGLRVREGG